MVKAFGGPSSHFRSPEFQALREESDAGLRAEGLLGLARRMEVRDRPDLALEIYAELDAEPSLPEPLRRRAREGREALLGRGSLARRAEGWLRRFVQEATDPAALFAMGGAGLVFRGARFLAMSRLAAAPTASLVTRGWGARWAAGGFGFAAEASAFPLLGALGRAALGRNEEAAPLSWSREFAASFLFLGALRLGQGATSLLRPGGLHPAAAAATGQLGLFAGILLGHGLEARWGLRQPQSFPTLLLDSFASLLQFQVAGRLSRAAFGPSLTRWERDLERRARQLSQGSLPNGLPWTSEWGLALADSSTPRGFREASGPIESGRLFMMGGGDGNQGGSGKGPPKAPGRVIYLDEYRRRRDLRLPPPPEAEPGLPGTEGPDTGSFRIVGREIAKGTRFPNQEAWRLRLRNAVHRWFGPFTGHPELEFRRLETRLEPEPRRFRQLIAYLAEHYPLEARLLLIQCGLLGPDSGIPRLPGMRVMGEIRPEQVFSERELDELLEGLWLRYRENLYREYPEEGFQEASLQVQDFSASLEKSPGAFLLVLSDQRLPREHFMTLVHVLAALGSETRD